jgi:hypothetical protein
MVNRQALGLLCLLCITFAHSIPVVTVLIEGQYGSDYSCMVLTTSPQHVDLPNVGAISASHSATSLVEISLPTGVTLSVELTLYRQSVRVQCSSVNDSTWCVFTVQDVENVRIVPSTPTQCVIDPVARAEYIGIPITQGHVDLLFLVALFASGVPAFLVFYVCIALARRYRRKHRTSN